MFRSFPLPVITPMLCVFGSYTFHLHPLSDIHRDIHSFHTTCCSALRCCHLLWRLLTSHSSLLLRQMRPSVRPHGISPEPFPVYSPDLRIKVTVADLDFDAFCHLIRLIRLTIRFLSVEPRFRYCFFSPTPRDVNLASRYRVRWQLRPLGLSPKVRDMPVIQKKRPCRQSVAGAFPDAFFYVRHSAGSG